MNKRDEIQYIGHVISKDDYISAELTDYNINTKTSRNCRGHSVKSSEI